MGFTKGPDTCAVVRREGLAVPGPVVLVVLFGFYEIAEDGTQRAELSPFPTL